MRLRIDTGQIAVDDRLLVGRLERFRDLTGNHQGIRKR
jgi:hypothetical protein